MEARSLQTISRYAYSFCCPKIVAHGVITQVQLLVRAFQVRGHHIADLDPLGVLDADLDNIVPPELQLSHYGWNERDLEKTFSLGPGILPHFATDGKTSMTLREIMETCKKIYCMSFGLSLDAPN